MWETLSELQYQVKMWSRRNFADQPSWKPLLGIGEEVGELNHSFLKKSQGIRLNEDHDAKMRDAVGDIVIYLADFCDREGINLEECIHDAWAEVEARDWTKR